MEKTIIVNEGICPECGCCDIISKPYYNICFKCGYIEECKKLFENSELKPYQNQEIKK